jgi:hypothetical protein
LQRKIGAIVAGLMVWAITGSALILALRITWPAYEAAHMAKSFTFAMQVARLTAGVAASLAAGAVAMRIAKTDDKAIWLLGLILLLLNLPIHLRDPVWSQYPGWYHLIFLGYLVPLVLLGGRLVKGNKE